MNDSQRPANKARNKTRTALLAATMAVIGHGAFAQQLATDSARVNFQKTPLRQKDWLSFRAGGAFHQSSATGSEPGFSFDIEKSLWKNLSLNAGMIRNVSQFFNGMYGGQTHYYASRLGVMKENYLFLKYGIDQKLGDRIVVNPYVNGGMHCFKALSPADQQADQKSFGIGTGVGIEYYPVRSLQHGGMFLDARGQFNHFLSDQDGHPSPARGWWLTIGAGFKIRK